MDTHALQSVTMKIPKNKVTALIGPSGCGKSTLLRCFNRLNDLIDHVTITGEITLDNDNIHALGTDVVMLRKNVGMVFQKPNPFPKSDIRERRIRAAGPWRERTARARQDR